MNENEVVALKCIVVVGRNRIFFGFLLFSAHEEKELRSLCVCEDIDENPNPDGPDKVLLVIWAFAHCQATAEDSHSARRLLSSNQLAFRHLFGHVTG